MRPVATCAFQHKQRHSMILLCTQMPPKMGRHSLGLLDLLGFRGCLIDTILILLLLLGLLFLAFLDRFLRAGFLGRVSLAFDGCARCRLDVPYCTEHQVYIVPCSAHCTRA